MWKLIITVVAPTGDPIKLVLVEDLSRERLLQFIAQLMDSPMVMSIELKLEQA